MSLSFWTWSLLPLLLFIFSRDCIAVFTFSLNIITKPVTFGCGHSGCLNCLTTLVSIATPKCPLCRAPFKGDELTINVSMDRMTRNLPLKCNSQGCEWQGSYSEAEGHWKQCPKVEESCPNDSCVHMAVREEMAAHMDACPKQKISCPDCKLSVTREWLGRHRTSMCSDSAMQCPLRCGTSIQR